MEGRSISTCTESKNKQKLTDFPPYILHSNLALNLGLQLVRRGSVLYGKWEAVMWEK
jgi:hypothetical protein